MNLFRSSDRWITTDDVVRSLRDSGAADCEILYVHSETSFGIPNPDLGRRAVLEQLHHALRALNVGTIVMPTFTFSFCNGAPFDRQKSKSLMGALNEYVRALPTSERSRDPLMSVVVDGDDKSIIRDLSREPLGRGGTFDKLHERGNAVRFLFLGVSPAKCFTYIHYVEKSLNVPYRYDRDFTGTIVDGDSEAEESWTLFVRYKGVEPMNSNRFVDFLRNENLLREVKCGNSSISTIREPDAYDAIAQKLREDIDYFLEHPHPRDRDAFFHAENMVAL